MYMYVHVDAYGCVHRKVHEYQLMFLCIWLYMHKKICVQKYIHAYIICLSIYIHTHVHACININMCVFACAYITNRQGDLVDSTKCLIAVATGHNHSLTRAEEVAIGRDVMHSTPPRVGNGLTDPLDKFRVTANTHDTSQARTLARTHTSAHAHFSKVLHANMNYLLDGG